ncbi:hypothetical protein [Aliivibrio fischeri]|uniref:hypothetical protein n=1 Tax=Aliivibrio fischeri TaxID=668 RepID=UPI0007C4BB4B|nr:hypothetical protein [Aliivibrio fischeri]
MSLLTAYLNRTATFNVPFDDQIYVSKEITVDNQIWRFVGSAEYYHIEIKEDSGSWKSWCGMLPKEVYASLCSLDKSEFHLMEVEV